MIVLAILSACSGDRGHVLARGRGHARGLPRVNEKNPCLYFEHAMEPARISVSVDRVGRTARCNCIVLPLMGSGACACENLSPSKELFPLSVGRETVTMPRRNFDHILSRFQNLDDRSECLGSITI